MGIQIPEIELSAEHYRSYPGIQITPIICKNIIQTKVERFLWEGIEDESVEIEEQESSSVPSVKVKNKSKETFLGCRGSIIRGGGQNRHLVHSFVLPEKGAVDIPVQCIQHGRWNPNQNKVFTNKKGDITSSSLRFKAKNQSETWSSIRETTTMSGTLSFSEDYTVLHDCLTGNDQIAMNATSSLSVTDSESNQQRNQSRERVQQIIKDFGEPIPGQVGVFVSQIDPMEWNKGRKVIQHSIEFFANDKLYGKVHNDVISSFAVDCGFITKTEKLEAIPLEPKNYEQLLNSMNQADWQKNQEIGKETRYEAKNDKEQSFGESISIEDDLVHLMYSHSLVT